jgi:malate synthase
VSASLFDFGLYLFHNARHLLQRGSGPYFYLPKLESRYEARLWNDVFLHAQRALGLPPGTIKATVLIETILAAFEMDEILWELRDHVVGLNCGRWDYIFSFIKKLGHDRRCVLPDRAAVTMTERFLRSYSRLLIRTCHRRGAHAIGGMAAFIPVKDDPEKNAAALAKVAADKRREAEDGHDGTWVAHPGLVEVARAEFRDRGPNQLRVTRDGDVVTAADLLAVPSGPRTRAGLLTNARVCIIYLEAWLRGQGCVPIDDLMEDAATAEISRAQVWQWLRHNVALDDGAVVDRDLVQGVVAQAMEAIRAELGSERFGAGRFAAARDLFLGLVLAPECAEFLTIPAYRLILEPAADTQSLSSHHRARNHDSTALPHA